MSINASPVTAAERMVQHGIFCAAQQSFSCMTQSKNLSDYQNNQKQNQRKEIPGRIWGIRG
jgi:hypothetical protein